VRRLKAHRLHWMSTHVSAQELPRSRLCRFDLRQLPARSLGRRLWVHDPKLVTWGLWLSRGRVEPGRYANLNRREPYLEQTQRRHSTSNPSELLCGTSPGRWTFSRPASGPLARAPQRIGRQGSRYRRSMASETARKHSPQWMHSNKRELG